MPVDERPIAAAAAVPKVGPGRPTVAVVAVHGVSDQRPFDTVRQIANLLLTRNRNGPRAAYTPGHETTLRLRVDTVKLAPQAGAGARHGAGLGLVGDIPPAGGRVDRSFHEAAHRLREARANPLPGRAMAAVAVPTVAPADWDDEESIDQTFARAILRPPPGGGPSTPVPEQVFETVRVETSRLEDGTPTCDVHVYEMYWADLSRLGTGVVAVFGQLFQILFHLCTLARHTADAAMVENADVPGWRLFSNATSWAVDVLTIWVAALNILLVGVAVTVLLSGALWALPRPAAGAVGWGVVGAVAVGAIGYAWSRGRRPQPGRPGFVAWACAPVLFPLTVVVGGWVGTRWPGAGLTDRVCGLVAVGAGAIVAGWLGRTYAGRRPGAGLALTAVGACLAIVAVVLVLTGNSSVGEPVGVRAGVTCFDVVMDLLTVWYLYIALVWLSSAAGWWAVRQTRRATADVAERDRAARAATTARLLLVLSAAAFTVIALPLWAAFWAVVAKAHVIPADMRYAPVFARLQPWIAGPGSLTVNGYFDRLIGGNQSLAFACVGAGLLAGGLLAAWGLGPIVAGEVWPPSADQSRLSASQGGWLSDGYRLVWFAGEILFVAMVVAYPAGVVWSFAHPGKTFSPVVETALRSVGVLAGTAVGGLLAFRGRLSQLAVGFRPVVDIVFDVDNHLREFPVGDNPRARIAARYASLLRYIAQWKPDDGSDSPGYSGIVIIAHSQGTVITADLFRFLQKEWPKAGAADPELAPILTAVVERRLPVDLFTMGCPLRQLYSLRFPHLYRWARNIDPRAGGYADPIPEDQLPLPAKLGVRRWVNLFRSGDYVGRFLWRTDLCGFQWDDTRSTDAAGSRVDGCIGAGAHTHYWDHTAATIAEELDDLIDNACRTSTGSR